MLAHVTARENPFPRRFSQHVAEFAAWLNENSPQPLPQFLVERLLLDGDGYLEGELLNGAAMKARRSCERPVIRWLPPDCRCPAVEAMARYDWVARVLDGDCRIGPTTIARPRPTASTPC